MLYKSIFHFLLILQKPTKLIILSVSLPNWQNYVNNLRILKNQLTIKNTFVKQMLIFCQFMMFWYDLSKFQLFSAIFCSLPPFFSEFWTFKLSHSKGFHTQDLILIYMVYLCPKNLHEHFGQAERVGTWSKCLIFSGAQLSNSQLWRGAEKNQNMFWKAQTSADIWLTKTETSL